MASLDELYDYYPAKYTMSNKYLVIIAHVRDETLFFYDYLGPLTTVILLTKPKCYAVMKIFLDLLNDLGSEVICLDENESKDKNYRMSQRSANIINSIIKSNTFNKILTMSPHNKYIL